MRNEVQVQVEVWVGQFGSDTGCLRRRGLSEHNLLISLKGEKMITKAKFVGSIFVFGNGSPVSSARRCRFCFYTSFGERSMVCSRSSSDGSGRRN